jgi:hypothetical protein
MTPMRSFAVLSLLFLFGAVACEDLNKPAYVPHSEPRKSCFSDVECPGSKCVKASGNDVQGMCDAPNAPSTAGGDAGPATAPDAPPAPSSPPAPQPQPGDLQI